MECYSVGLKAKSTFELKNELLSAFSKSIPEYIDIIEYSDDNINWVTVYNNFEHDMEFIQNISSNAISEFIINNYEEKFINKILNENYCYFNQQERKEILFFVYNSRRYGSNMINQDFLRDKRLSIVKRKIIEFFEYENKLLIDGFITFRLKDYVNELENLIDIAVDEYIADKEYKDFIVLLKYFVDIQEPKVSALHILVDNKGKYTLLNEDRTEITDQYINEFMSEARGGEMNYDDMLMSILITLAPVKIYLYNSERIKNRELLETINRVFSSRIEICDNRQMTALEPQIVNISPNEYLYKS